MYYDMLDKLLTRNRLKALGMSDSAIIVYIKTPGTFIRLKGGYIIAPEYSLNYKNYMKKDFSNLTWSKITPCNCGTKQNPVIKTDYKRQSIICPNCGHTVKIFNITDYGISKKIIIRNWNKDNSKRIIEESSIKDKHAK